MERLLIEEAARDCMRGRSGRGGGSGRTPRKKGKRIIKNNEAVIMQFRISVLSYQGSLVGFEIDQRGGWGHHHLAIRPLPRSEGRYWMGVL